MCPMKKKQRNYNFKIGIALSGGSVLGLAHIGVLKVLEEYDIKIECCAGTSMGSIVGLLYSSGISTEKMREVIDAFNIKKIAKLNGIRIFREGFFNTEKLTNFIYDNAKIKNIEQTKIPFWCNAVDLISGKEYVFKQGDCAEAIRASIAVPGIFNPITKDDMLLVDGGVLNNVPISLVKDMGADFVISVDVWPVYQKKDNLKNIIKIVISSFSALQIRHSKEIKKRELRTAGFSIDVPSKKDETDFSKEAMVFACELGENYARQNIKKLLRKLDNFQKKFNKNKNSNSQN